MNCSNIEVLDELQKLENMCGEYSGELKFLSKKIRRDIWIRGIIRCKFVRNARIIKTKDKSK